MTDMATHDGLMIGPIFPHTDQNLIFCMCGDEPLMFSSEEDLHGPHKFHAKMMRHGILPWSLAFLPVAKCTDHVVLDEAFLECQDLLTWQRQHWEALGLTLTDNVHFASPEKMYPTALSLLREGYSMSSTCFSHLLRKYADIDAQLQLSERLNSRTGLVELASQAGFRIPKTAIIKMDTVAADILDYEFGFPQRKLVVKADGQGGGYSVAVVADVRELQQFLRARTAQELFIVQEYIDLEAHDEYTCDFAIDDKGSAELINVRLKLTANNQWFGDVYSPRAVLNSPQLRNLTKCVNSLRTSGYGHSARYVFGVDFLQSRSEQFVIEINARLTEGLPAYLMLERLELTERLVYSHLDEISMDDSSQFHAFVTRHAYRSGRMATAGFEVIWLGFGPQACRADVCVWVMVIGDYGAFVSAKEAALAADSLPVASKLLETIENKALQSRFGA